LNHRFLLAKVSSQGMLHYFLILPLLGIETSVSKLSNIEISFYRNIVRENVVTDEGLRESAFDYVMKFQCK